MAKISVIVPVYNVKQYLERCINSITNQTFEDIEIFLVDDGSTDGSGELCDRLALTDERIKVFHKENGGVSSARNYGLDRVNSEYAGFVDGDDYIDSRMYEVLYDSLVKTDADVSICGYSKIWDDDVKVCETQAPTITVCRMDREEAIECVLLPNKGLAPSACNKLFKMALFEQIRYPDIRYAEDLAVIVDLFLKCKKIALNPCPLYYYARRQGSLTLSTFDKKNFDVIGVSEHNLYLIKENVPQLEDLALFRLYCEYKKVITLLLMSPKETRKRYKKEEKDMLAFLRKNARACIFNPHNTRVQKIAFAILLTFPELYKVVLDFFKYAKEKYK